MTYRIKFLIFLVLIHFFEIALAIFVLRTNKPWFVAAEVLILVSIGFSVYFFVSFSKPLKLINSGIESIKDKDFSMRLVKVGQEELDQLIEVYNHMIDRLRYERTLQQEQNYFLERLLTASPSGIIILDPDGKVKMMNPAAESFTGLKLSDVKDALLISFSHNPIVKELACIPVNETRTVLVSGLLKYKVHCSYFMNQGFRNQFLVIEELSNEIYKIERSAYEKVIRTISHEFNNSIGPINSILGSLKTHITNSEPEQQSDYESAIDVAIQRNYALNDFIKRYAQIFKLPIPIKESCNINDLITRLEKIFHYEIQRNEISVSLNLTNNPLIWNVDVNQFELVISNVIKNAIEATGRGGAIKICTSADPASMSVFNTGQPIPDEVQKQLFTPFFTTKKTGQGIGLTLVREILQSHDMKFALQSLPDGLTRFTIEST
jgi:nitrogen fixation/metabolism regulation signal transduction histidine kinase